MSDIDLPESDQPPPVEAGPATGPAADDEEYVYLPPEHSTLRRVLYGIGGVLAVVVVLAGLGGWWVLRQINPSGGPGDPVTLVVPTGSTTAQIGTLLQDKGVISSAAVFQYYVKFRGAGPFKAGEYDGLYENDSMSNVVTRLKKGPLAPKTRELAIPEGLDLAEIKAKILEVFPEMNAAELDTALQHGAVEVPAGRQHQPRGPAVPGHLPGAGERRGGRAEAGPADGDQVRRSG